MKYCTKCGEQLNDDAIVCPRCGCETELGRAYRTNNSGSSVAQVCGVLSIVFGMLGGFLGLILGIVCIASDKDKKYRSLGIIGIVLFLAWVVVFICLYAEAIRIVNYYNY